MKIPTLRYIAFAGLLLLSTAGMAQNTDIEILKVTDPARITGIQIGDVLERQIEVRVNPPYQISEQSLPLKGLIRDGIELADIAIDAMQGDQTPGYLIKLRYRVFANAYTPTMMQLPAEAFALTGGEQALSIKLPVWQFWFS